MSVRLPTIVHLDADAFFVSCELALKPELRGTKCAVGGRERGIISSASYEARACGVYTPMPTARALKSLSGSDHAAAHLGSLQQGVAPDVRSLRNADAARAAQLDRRGLSRPWARADLRPSRKSSAECGRCSSGFGMSCRCRLRSASRRTSSSRRSPRSCGSRGDS